jgi:hypothetical protein
MQRHTYIVEEELPNLTVHPIPSEFPYKNEENLIFFCIVLYMYDNIRKLSKNQLNQCLTYGFKVDDLGSHKLRSAKKDLELLEGFEPACQPEVDDFDPIA